MPSFKNATVGPDVVYEKAINWGATPYTLFKHDRALWRALERATSSRLEVLKAKVWTLPPWCETKATIEQYLAQYGTHGED